MILRFRSIRDRAPTPSCRDELRFRGPISGRGANVTDDEDEEGEKVHDGDDRRIPCGVFGSEEYSVKDELEDWEESFRMMAGCSELSCVLEPELDLDCVTVEAAETEPAAVAPALSSADMSYDQG